MGILPPSVLPQRETPLLIPYPQSVVRNHGTFDLTRSIRILADHSNKALEGVVELVSQFIESQRKETTESSPGASIQLSLSKELSHEAYSLSITPLHINMMAGSPAGLFYAFQTLLQLTTPARPELATPTSIACMVIHDQPAFSYRGMHLDVSRHFFPIAFIKTFIDIASRYKFNRFHWHLTDDQGWRIEIKKYPKLQEISAFRKSTLTGHLNDDPKAFDNTRYGGFYTQAEIREVVTYAKQRFVEVVPEIEMPGHAQAVLAAYPELGCTAESLQVATHWGIFENVFCPSENTFNFLEDVLLEVMQLFPSEYIHIGGDECPKTQWRNNSFCQNLIKEKQLKDEEHLQSYFIKRIGKFLSKHGRKLIGWDEILEGGLAKEATVMSWRGSQGGIDAAKLGHNVIMCPSDYCYFDMYQGSQDTEPLAIGGYLPVEKVFQYNPIPESLHENEAAFIIGAQGNVWTEYMPTSEQVEYMVLPRLLALSEAIWTCNQNRDFNDFLSRLKPHILSLQAQGLNVATHVL